MPRNKAVSAGTKARVARKAAPIAARGGAKAVRMTGRHAVRGAKAEAKLARAALRSQEPRPARYAKYALFAVAGLALGSILGRLGGGKQSETSSSFSGGTGPHSPQPGSPAGQRGETWGTGSPLGAAGGASQAANYQTPGEANTIGADRDYSDPAAGPLIGGGHPEMDITQRNQIIEQRVRTGIGEQVETEGLPKINVEVNDGVAELRGPVPSEDLKRTIGEIASNTEGVREVRNHLAVDSV